MLYKESMVLSVLAVKLRHFGRKDVIEHINFPQVPNSILEGLGRFADNHYNLNELQFWDTQERR